MRLSAGEVVAATGGEASGPPPAEPLRVVHDSRAVEEGDLFCGLPGEATHGALFAGDAEGRGANGLLIPRGYAPGRVWTVRVEDSRDAYGALAGFARRRWGGQVVAVTGSVGKSTTKELVAAAIGGPGAVSRSPASFNNEVGLPWTILAATGDESHLVLEMGARRPGDLAYLEGIAAPDVAVYTPIAAAHGEHLGGPAGVLREKASLVAGWSGSRTVVVAAGDPAHQRVVDGTAGARIVRWGRGGEVWAESLDEDDLGRPRIRVATVDGARADLALALPGRFQAGNALAAIAAAWTQGVPLDEAVERMEAVRPLPHRKEVHRLARGGLLLDDVYNAGPTSTMAALEWAAGVAAGRPLTLVLGDLLETGDPEEVHRTVGQEAADLGFTTMLTVGPLAAAARDAAPLKGGAYESAGDLADEIREWGLAGGVVLAKGSRATGLEKVVAAIREAYS